MTHIRYTNCTCPTYYIGYDRKKVTFTCPHMDVHVGYWFEEEYK